MSVSRTGNPESDREARFGAAGGASDTSSRVTLPAGDGGPVVVPDEALLRDGEFLRQGGDLVIRGSDGAEVVVQGYFAAGTRPDLTTPGGDVALSPGLVDSFLSAMAPGQYAQTAGPAQSPIGQVDELKGEAFAVRADGTRVQLATGDPVFEGDIVETGGGTSAIRMVFVDKTMFALGSDARLALDELVFDPSQSSGSSQFSILKGVFIFSSGQIAKTNNTEMTVITPVASIGIRGTEVAGRVDGVNSQFTLIDGAIEVTTQAGSVTLDGAGETTLVAGIDAVPSAPFVLSAAEYGVAYGGITGIAPDYFTALAKEISDSVDLQLAADVTFEGVLVTGTGDATDGGISPYRTETAGEETFSNPYLAPEPYEMTEILFESGNTESPPESSDTTAIDTTTLSTDTVITPITSAGSGSSSVSPPPPPAVHQIKLTVSDTASNDLNQDLSDSYVLPDLGPNSATVIYGAEMDIVGVDATTAVQVVRDASGDAGVALLSPWNSLKNVRADSNSGADLVAFNFVDTDVFFGDGGNSNITLVSVKRGTIRTGNGDDVVDIDVATGILQGPGNFDVATGAGDDTVVFGGSLAGASMLALDGGAGTDTLKIVAPIQKFDLNTTSFAKMAALERVDLAAADNAVFSLDSVLVAAMTDGVNALVGTSETLVIDGGVDDKVDLMGEVWNKVDVADIDGTGYTIYEHGSGVRIAAADDIAVA
ncbi:MAG: FecR domain-containing protein [Alphaproteobacteria bacterium]|nr:FecR domain-containing protein [Alphaproteobacteria bacterium]